MLMRTRRVLVKSPNVEQVKCKKYSVCAFQKYQQHDLISEGYDFKGAVAFAYGDLLGLR